MKEQLVKALEALTQGDVAPVTEEAAKIKALPRTAEGLFDTGCVDSDCFVAARFVYPVYAAFETECNRQAGYPDLLAQMHTLEKKCKESGSLKVTAQFLDMLITTIAYVTPQLYEYYRELVDIFRTDVKDTIDTWYKDGSFGGAEGKASGDDAVIRDAVARAGKMHCLLSEKYQEYM